MCIEPFLHENTEHLLILIHGSPQVVAFPSHPDKHFIKMPRVARSTTSMSESLRERLSEPETPLPHRLITDDDPPVQPTSLLRFGNLG